MQKIKNSTASGKCHELAQDNGEFLTLLLQQYQTA